MTTLDLDDEMLLDSPSPQRKQETPPSAKSGGTNAENFFSELVYTETQPNPAGFFADADDQVSATHTLMRLVKCQLCASA